MAHPCLFLLAQDAFGIQTEVVLVQEVPDVNDPDLSIHPK